MANRTTELHRETDLSPTEAEIQAFVEQGWSIKDIAETLTVAESKVEEARRRVDEELHGR